MLEFLHQSVQRGPSPFSMMPSLGKRRLKPRKSWRLSFLRNLACAALLLFTPLLLADPLKPIDLWPSKAPGESTDVGAEQDTTKPSDNLIAGKRLARIGNVTKPTLTVYLALKNAKVPAELHLYPTGGHGYGLRPSNHTVTTWPQRAADWMRASGWLAP